MSKRFTQLNGTIDQIAQVKYNISSLSSNKTLISNEMKIKSAHPSASSHSLDVKLSKE